MERISLTLRLPKNVWNKTRKTAEESGLSFNSYVSYCLSREENKNPKKRESGDDAQDAGRFI